MNYQPKIEKIYSRKRLTIIKLNKLSHKKYKNRERYKKALPIFMVLCISLLTFFLIFKTINPIFEKLCEETATSIATSITNEETTKVMNKYNYENFFTIVKDKDDNVQMVTANVLEINKITSDIALNIQKSMEKNENKKIYIQSGALTCIRYFSGVGPKIGLNIVSTGNIETNVKSEFLEKGVNQTIHRVYLNVKTHTSILTSFEIIEKTIENQIIIMENIIIGKIPSSYYNLNGKNTESETLRLID